MVATTSALPAAQLAFRALDAPLFVSKNHIASATAVIVRKTDAEFSTTEAVTGFPASYTYNGSRADFAKLASATSFYILVDAGSGNQITADCIIIEGHNFTDGNLLVRVSDAAVGGGGAGLSGTILTPVASVGTVADRQVDFLDATFTARFWEIGFTGVTSADLTIRQVWLGTQQQMRSKARDPSDPDDHWVSTRAESQARSGFRQRTLWSKLRALDLNFRVISATELAAARAVRDDTDVYTNSLWYCEDPNSDPTGSVAGGLQGRMIYGHANGREYRTPSIEGANRNFAIQITEAGPRLSP